MLRSFINTTKCLRTSLFRSQVAPTVYENKMKAFVRKPISFGKGDERLNLELQYYLLPNGRNRAFNFNRSLNEELGVVVDKIAVSIHKQADRRLNKKKKKNPGELPEKTAVINVKLMKNGHELPTSLLVDEAFTDDSFWL